MLPLFLATSSITLFVFILAFFLAVIIRNNGLIDSLWGLGFIVVALISYLLSSGSFSGLITLILVTLWGLRLFLHITLRNWGRDEDFRYAKWRSDWGSSWVLRSFFQIFLLQWFLLQLVSLPIILAMANPAPSWALFLGGSIWFLGFFFEAVGDYQLTIFKKNPASHGKLMTTGLWSLTRHPNYFGEATLWWGIALIAYVGTNNPVSIVGPLVIDFLLLYVSGIPLLEAKYKGRPDWEKYAKHTPAFFPRFPRLL